MKGPWVIRLGTVMIDVAPWGALCGDADDDTVDITAETLLSTTSARTTIDTTTAAFNRNSWHLDECDHGGKSKSIEAVEELIVRFSMCSPVPAFENYWGGAASLSTLVFGWATEGAR
jgi:hypothetical protein